MAITSPRPRRSVVIVLFPVSCRILDPVDLQSRLSYSNFLVADQENCPVTRVPDTAGMEMRMARFGKENRRQMMSLTVVRRTQMSDHMVRVTVGGDALESFSYHGGDQCFRLFFPRPGQTELRMPTFANNGWAAQYFLMPKDVRPYVRNYTVRAFHPESNELDVDFVVHGDGPASVWAQQAEPGSPVGMFDEGRRYRPREDAEWQLLVADGSGLPAVLAIAEETPPLFPPVSSSRSRRRTTSWAQHSVLIFRRRG